MATKNGKVFYLTAVKKGNLISSTRDDGSGWDSEIQVLPSSFVDLEDLMNALSHAETEGYEGVKIFHVMLGNKLSTEEVESLRKEWSVIERARLREALIEDKGLTPADLELLCEMPTTALSGDLHVPERLFITGQCRAKYAGTFIRPAVLRKDEIDEILERMPSATCRDLMNDMLVKNGNGPFSGYSEHRISVINKALKESVGGKYYRIGRDRYTIQLWEVQPVAADTSKKEAHSEWE